MRRWWFRSLFSLASILAFTSPLAAQTEYMEYVSIAPCRVIDTRELEHPYPSGYGAPKLVGGQERSFVMVGNPVCAGLPSTARAVSVNVTVVNGETPGFITVFPAGGTMPVVSTVNHIATKAAANSAIIALNASGSFTMFASANVHAIVDINGYFADGEDLASENTVGGAYALGSEEASPDQGSGNVAVGFRALEHIDGGANNTGVGTRAMGNGELSGSSNTGVGDRSLLSVTGGAQNSALGCQALDALTTGNDNVAVGCHALGSLVTGNGNVGIGLNAGINLTSGSNNVYINNTTGGGTTESNQVYIGNGSTQTLNLISVNAKISALASALPLPVLAGVNGILSLGISTARAKDDIRDMGDTSAGLMKLRPVTFRYKPGQGPGAEGTQFGLIAEEVAEIYPGLVSRDKTGQPNNVAYHLLPSMLLNELQRQYRQIETQGAKIAAQQSEIEELRARLMRLEDQKAVAEAAR